MVLYQMLGVFTIILWAGGIAFIIFYILKTRNLLRLPLAVETAGCDVLKHGEPAYPSEAWQEFQYQTSGGLPPNMMGSGVDLSSDVQTFQGSFSGKVRIQIRMCQAKSPNPKSQVSN